MGCRNTDENCLPSEEVWNDSVGPLVQRQCGDCHGEEVRFGAPYPLTSYSKLVEGKEGTRVVDAVAQALLRHHMPPPPASLSDEVANQIVGWATCGKEQVEPGKGLQSTAPHFQSPKEAPPGLSTVDLVANQFPIRADEVESYRCYAFELPISAEKFVRRFEMVIDNAQVVHHAILVRDTQKRASLDPNGFPCAGMATGSQLLFAWAPGESAFQFPSGGLRVSASDRFVTQIHYNNGGRLNGVTDSSGMRLFLSEPGGTEYGMVGVGPLQFSIPPASNTEIESFCTLPVGTQLLAGMPHMHGIGTGFEQRILRGSGVDELLIRLTGWRYETQLFYSLPAIINAGDRLLTRCQYTNTRSATVKSGEGTLDEMCFNFLYMTPPPTGGFCDEAPSTAPVYEPGVCASSGAPTDLPSIKGTLVVGSPPPLIGGRILDGRWRLAGATYYLSTASTAAGTIDVSRSGLSAFAQVVSDQGQLTVDVSAEMQLVVGASLKLNRPVKESFSGRYSEAISPLSLTLSCPAGSQPKKLGYTATADSLVIGTTTPEAGGLSITTVYSFAKEQ
jgi:hypothetical protein